MEYLENNFAQIEHVNQIIANNIDHASWDCFDTVELLKQFPQLGHYDSDNPENSYLQLPTDLTNYRGKTVLSHSNIRYNSFIVTIQKFWAKNEKDVTEQWYRYIFEVRNSLWDGIYVIKKSYKDSDGKYQYIDENDIVVYVGEDNETSVETGNVVVMEIRGDDRNRTRICFHMTMAGAKRSILETSMQLILTTEDEYSHQYDTTNYEKGTVSLNNGKKPSNITVTLKPCDEGGREISHTSAVGAYIPEQKISQVSDEFDMPYGPTSVPGDYYCLMEATSNKNNIKSSVQKIIHVKKVQKERIILDWEDIEWTDVWKGCVYKYRIPFSLENEFGAESENKSKLIGIPVTVTSIHMGGKRTPYGSTIAYDSKTKEYYVEATISYRGYYDNISYIEVEVSSEYGLGRLMGKKIIQHPWFIASSYKDIVGQLYLVNSDGKYVNESGTLLGEGTTSPVPNEYGTDWIFVENKTYNVSKTLLLNRNITIASVKGTGRSVFEGNDNNIIKCVGQGSDNASSTNMLKVNLVGLTFRNAECAVYSGAGTRLLVERCYFYNNKNPDQHHKGCSIFLPDTDYSVKHNELWKTEVRSSYFYNNKGNEIQSVGTTRIMGCLFKTDSASYLQQPEVKVVSVRSGKVTYVDNKSYINTGSKPMPSNHSYAKALAYVERGATFNGKGPSQLGGDMTLPLFGEPYNNQAYTYAIYYYPYSNIKTEIVCNPYEGYERRATGHGSSFKNWIYYDGYHFYRWNNGRVKGNTYDPWTKEELSVPENLGIYDTVKEKFINDYDPRFSGAKSMVSTFDK